MTLSRAPKIALAAVLVLLLAGGITTVAVRPSTVDKTRIIAYFDNSNGIYAGDDVVILGVPVGKIDTVEPEPQRVKISLWVDNKYPVPADAKAVILSPTLVTARTIQVTPAYTGGPVMQSGAIIPQQRTAVPVEWDDLRQQLQKLTDTLQPTQPGGQSTLGTFVSTAAGNLRGQGANIRDTLIKLSEAFSVLGDHSNDIFASIKNLSALVTALQSSTDLMRQLNGNLAAVTGLLANSPDEVSNAIEDLDTAVGDVQRFVADNREALGTTSDKLASVSKALVDSLDDVEQTLHLAPTALANFLTIYEPTTASLTGALALNNFSDPINFICGAIQAASRLNFEQSAKLCVQYLAPIVKNRQYNFLPIGENFFVGAQARPNEVTFSEDWLRPLTEAGRVRDYYEGPLPAAGEPSPPAASPPSVGAGPPPPPSSGALPAEASPTDPASGLPGMMVPSGGGS
jgi:phospholipid/cholesterol/gamma-HCH transport system substrate-binding protein